MEGKVKRLDEGTGGLIVSDLHNLGGSLTSVFVASVEVIRLMVGGEYLGVLEEQPEQGLLMCAVDMTQVRCQFLDGITVGTVDELCEKFLDNLTAVVVIQLVEGVGEVD